MVVAVVPILLVEGAILRDLPAPTVEASPKVEVVAQALLSEALGRTPAVSIYLDLNFVTMYMTDNCSKPTTPDEWSD